MSGTADRAAAVAYLRENFALEDRLAVVLINHRNESAIQRLSSAERIASSDVQAWLAEKNEAGFDVYVSMNALGPGAQGRTKADVHSIRHIYLDFDDEGTAAVEALRQRMDLPTPNYLVNTSPGKWQVIWKAEGFIAQDAETLQRALASETRADPAATDCSRVLRWPGYYNQKYDIPHLIRAERLTETVYRPEQFSSFIRTPGRNRGREDHTMVGTDEGIGRESRSVSQSERDWAYAKRALARGDAPAQVIATIAQYRRYDKHDPHYYAELTVKKAGEALAVDVSRYDPPRSV